MEKVQVSTSYTWKDIWFYLDVEEKAFHWVGKGEAEFDQGYEYHRTDQSVSYHCLSDKRTIWSIYVCSSFIC